MNLQIISRPQCPYHKGISLHISDLQKGRLDSSAGVVTLFMNRYALIALLTIALPAVSYGDWLDTSAESPTLTGLMYMKNWRPDPAYPPCYVDLPFLQQIKLLREKVKIPIVFPDGSIELENNIRPQLGGVGPLMSSETLTLRAMLDDIARTLILKWNYDKSSGRIIMVQDWLVQDRRSNRELVHALLTEEPRQVGIGRFGPQKESFPWQMALDALITKPNNFKQAWKIRTLEDCQSRKGSSVNAFTGLVHDTENKEHLLVINTQPIFCTPGEGSMTYYLFDSKGRFEQGAWLSTGWRCSVDKVEVHSHKVDLSVAFNLTPQSTNIEHFLITPKGLKLDSVTDLRDGSVVPLQDYKGSHFGTEPLHVAGSP